MKARILKRSETILSPWVRLVEKEVEFSPGQPAEVYHSMAPPDYITIIAETPGEFKHQLHIAAITLLELHNINK